MTFSTEQIKALAAPLSRENVSTRRGAGTMQLSYIESHHAIREANRIFGFDGWSSETVECRCICDALGSIAYIARVRITVFAGDRVIIREGVGAGHSKEQNLAPAHEKAAKESESDAQKRALRHFGDQFGLALYDKSQENVTNAKPVLSAPAQDDPAARKQAQLARMEERIEQEVQKAFPGAQRTDKPAPRPPVIPTVKPAAAVVQDAQGKRTSGEIRAGTKARGGRVDPAISTKCANAMLARLSECTTSADLETWSGTDNKRHADWVKMSLADQNAVRSAYRAKGADIKRLEQGVPHDPETGELLGEDAA